ncbi:AAA family ATPase [Lusitaniella coriacea LEGE 07157]|uniref:Circadian input-output histidine kinase CikA n=1 Tax=Lusitaniella coriacea LEGE 07157 TaxID=945747 RepID=A0A8J7IX73_9CYAN|nr:AAA family ATPase [Lusitaniella coriacea]MBE9118528.1 AAA family ATPase [Lusitaniella coriacea LEGE 07157]
MMTNSQVTFPGYHLAEQLYKGSRTLVYRGTRNTDGKPVIIKILRNEYPTFSELVQFRNQYTIAQNLDLPGIVKPLALKTYRNGYALVMPDEGYASLQNGYRETDGATGKQGDGEKKGKSAMLAPDKGISGQFSIAEFLKIGIQLAEILHGLSQNRVIHKDIKPANILIHPETKQVKLIDFSISSLLPKETQEVQNPNVLEGTLAYLSPEQTGRMNRGIDYRSDFYSLGVTFYELLTGKLPFQSDDPMELVHCHIAKTPSSVNTHQSSVIREEIPQILSDLVMKLMAKNVEERYQNALGLKSDLEQCLKQWTETGTIEEFELGQRDVRDRFIIPDKLYGREAEVAQLLTSFERVADGNSEIMLVAGYSGVGKTAVINEVHKPIVRQRGYFIKGKFDQFNRNIPFRAFVIAFRDLMGQLLSENDTQLEQWKTKILNALGENAQVIIEVIPELEGIIGEQPLVPELSGTAAQNRFNLLFNKFVRVFATKNHPLVLFLDDLQWADSASLNLLKLLMGDAETEYSLVLGAYRDNEVYPAHPLMLTLDEIKKNEATVNTIILNPLTQSGLNHLIANTLSCPLELAVPLTELVYQKTKGNPFFATQFIKGLHEDGEITFNLNTGYWQCDIAKVRQLSLTDDVVAFIASRLHKLSKRTQEVLKLAACIGNTFDLATLAIISELPQENVATALWKALQEGLVLPVSETYKFFQGSQENQEDSSQNISVGYKFLHDRVQQASYSLIPDDEKQATHLSIGQLLKNQTPPDQQEEKIFEIVNQLNMGKELISSPAQRDELAQLNLLATQKAKTATAYQAAWEYCATGIGLLAGNCWETQYKLILDLYVEGLESAYLSANFEKAEKYADIVLKRANSLLDKVKVYEVQIQMGMAKNESLKAIQIALEVLELLGVELPKTPTMKDIQAALQEVGTLCADKSIEDFMNLPEMTDPTKIAALQILSNVIPPSTVSAPALFPLIVAQQVILSVKYGNAPLSAYAYVSYGFLLCAMEGGIEQGYEFGQLALLMLERSNSQELKAKILMIFYSFICCWKNHPKIALQPLLEAHQSGLENGDIEFSGYSTINYGIHSFLIGRHLQDTQKIISNYTDFQYQIKLDSIAIRNRVFQQLVLNLAEDSSNPCLLEGSVYDERKMLSVHQEQEDGTSILLVYFSKLVLCYLFNNLQQSIEHAKNAEPYLDAMRATHFVPIFHFYKSLAHLAIYNQAPERQAILECVAENQKKMEYWAHHAPMNFQHKYDLVEAEKHRVLGEKMEAIELYEKAIAGAKANKYLQEEALGNELAAKFYLDWGKDTIAQAYLQEAYYCYARWGAKAKTDHLEANYPQLLAPILQPQPSPLNSTATIALTSSSTTSSALDFTSILKASQTLSGEIELNALLSQLMHIVLENAGADTGALILNHSGTWEIAARCTNGNTQLSNILLEQADSLPISIINTVKRTQKTVLINQLAKDTRFAGDAYLIQQQPKSLFCTPILNQNQLIGILYLENNLSVDAFMPERIEVLNLLCSQAAISIENARLYRTLEYKVEERTAALRESNRQLEIAREAADSANAAKSRFLANMSHELRSPLNAILGFAQIMTRSQNLPSEHQENVGIISRSGEHLLTLINNVLDLSKIEAGKTTLNPKNFDLHRLLDDIYDMFQLKAKQKGLQLLVEYDVKIPRYIHTDEVKLRQVLINLINNALKFTAQGRVSLWVRYRENEEQVNLAFEIEDTGAGIAPEEMESLFEAFSQTETGKQAKEGTGLGLSISRKFVQLMGGEMKVSSQVGVGTTFSFELSVPVADSSEMEIQSSQRHRVIALKPHQPTYRILVVDDKTLNRQLLVKLLSPLGFTLKEAENGAEAVEIWQEWQPHLIWMDMQMPVMDGWTATQKIKSIDKEGGEGTKILALTASVLEEERASVMQAGCDDFLRKPFREEQIFQAMAKHLGVEYCREKVVTTETRTIAGNQEQALTVEAFAALPEEWVVQLKEAIWISDLDLIATMVKQIATKDAALAETLKQCLHNFEYEKVLSLIDAGK